MRPNHGDPRANRVTLDKRHVPHADARYVRDSIQVSDWKDAGSESDGPCPRTRQGLSHGRPCGRGQQEPGRETPAGKVQPTIQDADPSLAPHERVGCCRAGSAAEQGEHAARGPEHAPTGVADPRHL